MSKKVNLSQIKSKESICIFQVNDLSYLVCDDENERRFLFVFKKIESNKETNVGHNIDTDKISLRVINIFTLEFVEFETPVGEYEKAFGEFEEMPFAKKCINDFEKEEKQTREVKQR